MATNKPFTRIVTASMLALSVLIPATAAAESEEFRVNLIATIDDDPAMEHVEWTVYKDGNEAYTTARKHTTHVNIPSGKYEVVARLTSNNRTIERKRSFWVRNDTQVVVPLD